MDSAWKSIAAIAFGSALGALMRWQLGERLNSLWPSLPLGTLGANLIGAYVIGVAIAYFAGAVSLSPEWRLFIITGFCGGLTTFSSFSAEAVVLLQQGRFSAAALHISTHLFGSLLLTSAGMATLWVGKKMWL